MTAQAGPGLLLLEDLRGRAVAVPELTEATRRALTTLSPPLTYQRNPVDTGCPAPGSAGCSARSPAIPAWR